MEATFKYHADFTIDFFYENLRIQPYDNPTEFKTCWQTVQVNEIFTMNTSNLSKPKVEQLPLAYVRADKREFSVRYSLLLKQLSITKEAYNYWNTLERQIKSQESLYNSQPFQVRGNIINVDNPEEPVLGFFLVAGQTEKRIFLDRPEELETEFSYCFPPDYDLSTLPFFPRSFWPIYIYEDEMGRKAIGLRECFDCRMFGGTLIEPDFWE